MTEGLGAIVEYRDSDGRIKPALVTATPATIDGRDDKTGIEAPQAGHAHLHVFSFTGGDYRKDNVPMGDGPGTFTPPKEVEAAFAVTG